MSFSLYDATIPVFVRFLGAVRGLTEKAESFCAERGMAESELLERHFGPDMLPLKWQIKWTSTHSMGAIRGVRAGTFSPDRSPPGENFAALRAQIDETLVELEGVTREEIESFVGRDMKFSAPARNFEFDFTAENFLTGFSLPNFYFHATTAYDLLRDAGVSLGKGDFLGKLPVKQPA